MPREGIKVSSAEVIYFFKLSMTMMLHVKNEVMILRGKESKEKTRKSNILDNSLEISSESQEDFPQKANRLRWKKRKVTFREAWSPVKEM